MDSSLLNLLIVAAAIALTIFAIDYKIKRRKLETLGNIIPGPKPLPLLGNILTFVHIKNAKDLWDILMVELKKCQTEYGNIFRYWIGPVLIVFVCDVEDMTTLLNSQHASMKHWWYVRVLNFMSHGAFGLNGKVWHGFRKAMVRFFPLKSIQSYVEVFVSKSEQLMSIVETKVGAGVVNVHELIKYYSLDNISITHLGAEDMNEMEENRHDFFHHLEQALDMTFRRVVKPQYIIDSIFHMSPAGKELRRTEKNLTSVSRRIVQNRLDVLSVRGVDLNDDFEEECYTDYIIKKGIKDGATMQKMALMLTDLVVAGSDTTGIAMAYTILCLAMYPEYQEKAYQEQLDIFGDSDRPPTFKEAMGMPYLSMCYKEAIRLHGVIGIARSITGDVEVGGYTVPEGAAIYLLFYVLHRDPRFYCRPNEFYPDHFLPEAVSRRPKNSYIVFSHGSRNCPGAFYSQISAKILLSQLIRKFRFTSPLKYSDLRFRFSLMLENVDGYPVEIHSRMQKSNVQNSPFSPTFISDIDGLRLR
ncbi:cytochrome P450 [Nesidiocoris tenuis]|uniref:Cytochrome P450 n=1 Tax=Nesidiocoris tenuis TaxID=355587 RepID=A0ABN7ATC7_9HEMI|nr:cytochrome P450 [Nesidiocoris tenuis]